MKKILLPVRKIIPEINILDEKAFFIDEIEKSELK